MTIRRAILSAVCACLAVFSLPGTSALALTRHQAREIIDNRGADPLCGIWRIGGDGALIAILPETASTARFEIYLLDSPDMSVIPGNKIGSATATGQPGIYDAELAQSQSLLKKRQRYIFTLDRDGYLSLKPYKQGKKVSLWRLLPYLFRASVSVSDINTRPASVDGAIKVYPPTTPERPILL